MGRSPAPRPGAFETRWDARPAGGLRGQAGRHRRRAGCARRRRGQFLAAADAIAAEDGRAALETSERLARSGRDLSQFGCDLLAHLRQLLVIRTIGEVPATFSVTAANPERLRVQAEAFSDLALTRAIDHRRGVGGDQGGR